MKETEHVLSSQPSPGLPNMILGFALRKEWTSIWKI